MRLRNTTQDYTLSDEDIDQLSEDLGELLAESGITSKNVMRVRISLEDCLLRLQDRFGSQDSVTLVTGSRMGSSFVRIEHEGQIFNPMSSTAEMNGGWGASLLVSLPFTPQYSYTSNKNVLRISYRDLHVNPSLALLISFLVSITVGVVGMVLIPEDVRHAITEATLTPLSNGWINILNVLAAPMIFLMTIAITLNIQKVREQGGDDRYVTVRYFLLSFLAGGVAVVVARGAYGLPFSWEDLAELQVRDMLAAAEALVPKHVLEPFVTSNTPQLLVIGFVVAKAIATLGDRVEEVARLMHQMNMVSVQITNWVSSLAPIFAGFLLVMQIWNNQIDVLVQIWRPLLLGLLVTSLLLAGELVSCCVRYGVRPIDVVRKVSRPFWITVKAGTLDASYGEAEHSCKIELGIDRAFTDVALPQGLVLYMPASIVGTLIFILFCARMFGVPTTPMWFVAAVVLDVLLFVATPPVPGANLLAFIAIFQQLGISNGAILDAMIFDILFGIFANAANQVLLQAEMVRQAASLGLLNKDAIRRPRR